MPLTATVKIEITGLGNDILPQLQQIVGTGLASVDELIADDSTDESVAFAFVRADTSFVALLSDRSVTVKTNSDSEPGDTIALAANKPLVWVPGNGDAEQFSADVTGLFVTNASGATARLQAIALYDATP